LRDVVAAAIGTNIVRSLPIEPIIRPPICAFGGPQAE
jgi:hypothetical protein